MKTTWIWALGLMVVLVGICFLDSVRAGDSADTKPSAMDSTAPPPRFFIGIPQVLRAIPDDLLPPKADSNWRRDHKLWDWLNTLRSNTRIRVKGRLTKSEDEKDHNAFFVWHESIRVHDVILDGGSIFINSDLTKYHLVPGRTYEIEGVIADLSFVISDYTPDGTSVQADLSLDAPFIIREISDPTTRPALNGVKELIADAPKNFLPSNDKGKWRDYDLHRFRDWVKDYMAEATIRGSGVFKTSEKGVPVLISSELVRRFSTVVPKTIYLVKAPWKNVQTMVVGREYEFEGKIEYAYVPEPEYLDLDDADLNIEIMITVTKPVTIREKSKPSTNPSAH